LALTSRPSITEIAPLVVPNENQTSLASRRLTLAITLLVGAVAAGLIIAQGNFSQARPELSLSMLTKRADLLDQVSDPVKRDSLCIPLSGYGRQLDTHLSPDARVFFSGMVGRTNGGGLGYYFFLRNYLFPREVAISLGTEPVFHDGGWFSGTPCDSPAELATNGFDLLIRFENNGPQLIPLTQKGVPR
jgi:hypothetical protein